MRVAIINGPNLNMLGIREPEKYGSATLTDLERLCADWGKDLGVAVECYQSNCEGGLVDIIQRQYQTTDYIILNAGAYSHTSIAVRDALLAVNIPLYEVHVSNIYARENFRHHSYISDIAIGVICGFGIRGYHCALQHIART